MIEKFDRKSKNNENFVWKCFSQWKPQRMRTRRVSHLPVAKGTKQWTPRLQSTVMIGMSIKRYRSSFLTLFLTFFIFIPNTTELTVEIGVWFIWLISSNIKSSIISFTSRLTQPTLIFIFLFTLPSILSIGIY